MDKFAYPKFEDATQNGTIAGSLAGAGIAGLISYLYYRNKKNQSIKSRILKSLGWAALGGLGGAAGGAYIGRMYGRHKAYVELSNKIRKDLEKTEKRPGRVIYVDCVDNRWSPREGASKSVVAKTTKGGLPVGHAMLAVIDDKSKDMHLYQINTIDPDKTIFFGKSLMASAKRKDGSWDRDKLIMGWNAVRRARAGETPILSKSDTIHVGDASNAEIAKMIGNVSKVQNFGERVILHEGDHSSDIRLPVNYMIESYNNTLRDGGGGYSAVPGGYNCGTSAREAFDLVQKSPWSHRRDMLWGGGSTANAPSLMNTWSNK